MTLRVFCPGVPVPQGSLRRSRGRGMYHANPKLDAWRGNVADTVALARKEQRGRLWEGPVRLELVFTLEPPKRPRHRWYPITQRGGDLDKLCRAVCDALEGVLYLNDAQVCILESRKSYGSVPGVLIWAEEI